MTSYLLATASVHVTAAAADYLDGRAGPADDVIVVGVRETGDSGADGGGASDRAGGDGAPSNRPADRDVEDAANVARSRLAAVAPEIDLRDGEPVAGILAAVADHDPDVVILGSNGGTPEASGLGTTAAALLADLDRPVVVVDPGA